MSFENGTMVKLAPLAVMSVRPLFAPLNHSHLGERVFDTSRRTGVSRNISFTNMSSTPIVAIDPTNVPIVVSGVRPESEQPRAQFIVSVTTDAGNFEERTATLGAIEHRRHLTPSNREFLEALGSEIRSVQDSIVNYERNSEHSQLALSRDKHKTVPVTIEHKFRCRDILEAEGGVYDHESGYLFIALDYYLNSKVVHPLSTEASDQADLIKAKAAKDEVTHVTEIRVVANDGELDALFGYSHKSVVRYRAVKELNKLSGVYILHKPAGVPPVETFLTFDEAREKYGFYSTREAAMTNGNPERLIEKQKAENEIALSGSKAETEARKAEREQRKENTDLISNAVKLCVVFVGAIVTLAGILRAIF